MRDALRNAQMEDGRHVELLVGIVGIRIIGIDE